MIAPKQRERLDHLGVMFDELDAVVGREMRPEFRDLRARLDGWAARVAVIGQVKAGKSTFLNAFLYNHDFLPSDVNPWTSVVTNIRINMPDDPVSGASFEFFGASDWKEIIDGDAKIRTLTERLLPGFDTELLRRQSVEMQRRAEARLGKQYGDLLGTTHDYDYVSPDLLRSYVCAGPDATEEQQGSDTTGRYAALTKVANVYSRMPEFQVPTIITDTPGVNDPFLVRDEFTCRSLDKSDVFIVVLSAHQPLTDVDIALIRILAKQDNKDCLIFVNRIDELDDYDVDVPRVLQDVTSRLRRAIPEIDFTIVAGSGYLADLCLRGDDEAEAERAALDDARLARYIRSHHGRVPKDRFERLRLASGVDQVKAALSRVIDAGVGNQQLTQIKADLRAELHGALFVTRRERDTLQKQVSNINREVAEMAIEDLQTEVDTMKRAQKKLEESIDSASQRMDKVLSKSWSRLESQLVATIDKFVDEQKPVLEDRIFSDNLRGTSKPMEIELGPLQRAIEREVEAAWEKSRAGSDVVLNVCISACRHALEHHFDDRADNIALDDLPHDAFASTLTLAKRNLQVDMIANRGMAFWRRPRVDLGKTLEAFRTIAAAELRPAMEKILAAFNEAQVERASAGSERIQVMLRMVETSLSGQISQNKRTIADLELVARDPEVRRGMALRLQSQMEVLERRQLELSAVEGRLARSTPAKAA
ncbi:MAG: dynamin family protein [Paracoccaceae bacterium]|nr:dynamin family protein [Paracoccaceae bacterium]